jgi:hypothetical protein
VHGGIPKDERAFAELTSTKFCAVHYSEPGNAVQAVRTQP